MRIPFKVIDGERTPVSFIEKYKVIDCLDIKQNYYEASNMGMIREIESGKEIPRHNAANGYLAICLIGEDGYVKTYADHRVIAGTFCNPDNLDMSNMVVNHKNSIRHYNTALNLELCTFLENVQHGNLMRKLRRDNISSVDKNKEVIVSHKRHQGDTNGNAKLTTSQVQAICEHLEIDRLSYKDILISVGLEPSKKNLDIMTKIRSGKLWCSVSKNYAIPKVDERSKQVVYSDEQIHTICRLLENNTSKMDIGRYIGAPIITDKEKDKYLKFINRIKDRKTYTHISKDYKF